MVDAGFREGQRSLSQAGTSGSSVLQEKRLRRTISTPSGVGTSRRGRPCKVTLRPFRPKTTSRPENVQRTVDDVTDHNLDEGALFRPTPTELPYNGRGGNGGASGVIDNEDDVIEQMDIGNLQLPTSHRSDFESAPRTRSSEVHNPVKDLELDNIIFWKPEQMPAAEVIVTDVTNDDMTITIRECSTRQGFFKEDRKDDDSEGEKPVNDDDVVGEASDARDRESTQVSEDKERDEESQTLTGSEERQKEQKEDEKDTAVEKKEEDVMVLAVEETEEKKEEGNERENEQKEKGKLPVQEEEVKTDSVSESKSFSTEAEKEVKVSNTAEVESEPVSLTKQPESDVNQTDSNGVADDSEK